MSETEYLEREVADAKTAFLRSVSDLKSNAKVSLDLSAWARAYPWPAVGAAAATGFAIAAMFRSRAKSPQGPPAGAVEVQAIPAGIASDLRTAQAKSQSSRSLLASISPALFDLAKLIIETVIMSAIRSAQAPVNDDQQPNADVQTQKSGFDAAKL